MKRHWCVLTMMVMAGSCSAATRLSHNRVQQVIKHLQVIRELKTRRAEKNAQLSAKKNKNESSWSQTDAHLSLPTLHENVASQWKYFFEQHGQLIIDIRENERKHSDDYYVFYHAQQKSFIIIQDFIKEIFELFQMCHHLESFAFLRFWSNMPSIDVNTFIDENNSKNEFWDDHQPDIVPLLLSVNLSLFGNSTIGMAGECTFQYFLSDRSIMAGGVELSTVLTAIFDYFDFDKRYIDQLFALMPLVKSGQGLLFQICIPKEMVDSCVYLSHPYGIPFKIPVIDSIFDSEKQRHRQISPILELYAQGRDGLELLKKNDRLMKILRDKAQCENIDINNEELFAAFVAQLFDRFQARIFFTRDIMLSPTSGVKIFRYTTIPDDAMADYTKRLQNIAQEIVSVWLEKRKNRESIQGSKLDVLLTQLES